MTTEITLAYEVHTISEDLIRKSLTDAINIIENVKHGKAGNSEKYCWFDIISTGQDFLLHTQRHLNNELDALLRGTYVEFIAGQVRQGKLRSK